MLKKKIALISLVALAAAPFMPALAQMMPSGVPNMPECQFTGQPTSEQMAACQAAAQAQQSPLLTGVQTVPPNMTIISDPGNMVAPIMPNMPEGGFDMSQLPQMPAMPEGAPMPEFMGQPLEGQNNPMVGRLGAAFDQIREGMLKADDGINQMKDGQIKIDPSLQFSLDGFKNSYKQAQDAFQNKDYQKAGQLLMQMKGMGLEQKFSKMEESAVSADLINDVQKKLEGASKSLDNITDDTAMEAKAKIMAALDKVKEAKKDFEAGRKKDAAAIMKELRNMAPEGDAADASGNFKGLSPKVMGMLLEKINKGLTQAGEGFVKSEKNGISVPADAKSLLDEAKGLYAQAQAAYDKGDYTTTMSVLKTMKDKQIEEKFTNFKQQMFPPERMDMLSERVAGGIKALEITIDKAKAFNIDPSGLEDLLSQVKKIKDAADQAKADNDVEAFIQYMDMIDNLNIREKVDSVFREVANSQAKDMVKQGLDKMNGLIDDFTQLLATVKTSTGDAVLADLKDMVAKAQTNYDAGQYMDAGKNLDEAVADIFKLSNILQGAGAQMTGEQKQSIDSILGDSKDVNDFANLSPEQQAQMESMMGKMDATNMSKIKNSLMGMNPDLLDNVIAMREKNKDLIDQVIKDVLPYVPENERSAILDGKTGLLAEIDAANTTIDGLKKIKGLTKDASKTISSMMDKVKKYNFTPEIAQNLEDKMANFNNNIQSGEMKDPTQINNYIKLMQKEVDKDMKAAAAEKFKDGILPAKNIDDNNPLFDEIKQLKDDGAISPDKKGNIDLTKRINKKALADMINKTIDMNAVASQPGNANVGDILKTVMSAYKVGSDVNIKDPNAMARFAKGLGVNLKPADLKKAATVGTAAEIIANADNQWGNN